MARKSINPYPDNWRDIAILIKTEANWSCVRCNHPSETGYILTVHHLDMNPMNNNWWNLAALCQRCHLIIQSKVIIERTWMFDHSEWFRPYAAGYYAFKHGLPHDKPFVMAHMADLLELGKPFPTMSPVLAGYLDE